MSKLSHEYKRRPDGERRHRQVQARTHIHSFIIMFTQFYFDQKGTSPKSFMKSFMSDRYVFT